MSVQCTAAAAQGVITRQNKQAPGMPLQSGSPSRHPHSAAAAMSHSVLAHKQAPWLGSTIPVQLAVPLHVTPYICDLAQRRLQGSPGQAGGAVARVVAAAVSQGVWYPGGLIVCEEQDCGTGLRAEGQMQVDGAGAGAAELALPLPRPQGLLPIHHQYHFITTYTQQVLTSTTPGSDSAGSQTTMFHHAIWEEGSCGAEQHTGGGRQRSAAWRKTGPASYPKLGAGSSSGTRTASIQSLIQQALLEFF